MTTGLPPFTAPSGYRPQAHDTGVDTDWLYFSLLRQRSLAQRLEMGAQLTRSARQFSINCFRQRFAHLNAAALARKIAEAWLQEHCPPTFVPGGSPVAWIQDSIQLAVELHSIFDALQISYYVTGGVAAIAYGEPRTTQDLDVVLQLSTSDLPQLVHALEQAEFYVAGVDDVMAGRLQTLSITQIQTISRADLVIAPSDDYERVKLQRRQSYAATNDRTITLISPEDLVISKLRWGQQHDSQKQWRDVLGILKTQQESLDYTYLYDWAMTWGLAHLLEIATVEAGVQTMVLSQKV